MKWFFSIVLIFLLLSCSKSEVSPNQKPIVIISYVTEGMQLTLNGSTSDADGTVKKLMIDWGDNKYNEYENNDFSQLNIPHTYVEPATYILQVTAIDDFGDSTFQTLNASIDFNATSLDGIKPELYKSAPNEYLILTINLHTYQESQQSEKLNMITDVIGLMDIDFIALQECAQHRNAALIEGIIREDNMALLIAKRLKEKYNMDYHFIWNWAHYGWDVWEEGVAVLSKYPEIESEDRYISTSTSTSSITSRKVIYGAYQLQEGRVNLFSAHTHWRISVNDSEQNHQIENIQSMVNEKELSLPGTLSFVCGDFNGNPTSDAPWSEGYFKMINGGEYLDAFLEIYPDANSRPALSIYNTINGNLPGRIDYIFPKTNSRIQVVDAQIIFSPEVVGKVSDHFGVITKIKISP